MAVARVLLQKVRVTKEELIGLSRYFVPREGGLDLLAELRSESVSARVVANSLSTTEVPALHHLWAPARRAPLAEKAQSWDFGTLPLAEGATASASCAQAHVIAREKRFVGSFNWLTAAAAQFRGGPADLVASGLTAGLAGVLRITGQMESRRSTARCALGLKAVLIPASHKTIRRSSSQRRTRSSAFGATATGGDRSRHPELLPRVPLRSHSSQREGLHELRTTDAPGPLSKSRHLVRAAQHGPAHWWSRSSRRRDQR